jgi:hypothetical protein
MGLVNPEGYIAFSLFPHLSVLSLFITRKRWEFRVVRQQKNVDKIRTDWKTAQQTCRT